MHLFPKQIMDETITYFSTSEISTVKEHAKLIFAERKTLRDSLYLTGRFISEDQFELKQYSLGLGSFSTYSKANLKVHLYKNEQGLTQFNLTVSPNSAYPTLFVLTPVLFIYILFAFPSDLRGIIFYITIAVLAILTLIILLLLSKVSKNNLLNKCVKLFSLQVLNCKS